MKKTKILLALLLLTGLNSCEKYLSEEPKPQQDIKTVDQLRELADNAVAGPAFASTYNPYCYISDDFQIDLPVFKNYPGVFNFTNINPYTFDIKSIEDQSSDSYYTAQYKKIFTANVILTNIDAVSGAQADKNQVKADAYFIRAEANWDLVNYYCQPYAAANMAGLGLPLKQTTGYAESLTRSTLQQTYDFILSDISQAQALTVYADVQPTLRWRVSNTAIEAFLSRYYLFTGDYTSCITHANKALQSTAAQLVDYNTIGAGTPAVYTNPASTLKYSALNNYTLGTGQVLSWGEMFYDRFEGNPFQVNIPSQALLALYDQTNDLRYKLFMIPDGGRRLGIITPSVYRYTMFADGTAFIIGPGIAEVLLNKAEASARVGDIATATATINLLRAKRFVAGSSNALSFANQPDAVAKILQERRRELPFTFRFWDIRRFSVNSDASDDVTITHPFYKVNDGVADLTTTQTYTLQSPNLVVPINNIEIANSRGQIQQNVYK